MSKENGKKTTHPGIRRDVDGSYIVRVAQRGKGGRHREKERRIQGALVDAIKEREALRHELKAELDNEKLIVTRPPRGETLTEYSKRWLRQLKDTGRNRVHVIHRNIRVLQRFIVHPRPVGPDVGAPSWPNGDHEPRRHQRRPPLHRVPLAEQATAALSA